MTEPMNETSRRSGESSSQELATPVTGGAGPDSPPNKGAEFRVWWTPQLPMKAFLYPVPDYANGKMLTDALAQYDLFQFEHHVKPDYCNAGGIQWRHPTMTDGEWWDLDEDEAEELGFADGVGMAPRPTGTVEAGPGMNTQ